jgi:hypothetical protein
MIDGYLDHKCVNVLCALVCDSLLKLSCTAVALNKNRVYEFEEEKKVISWIGPG